jgi:hypothetical protein
MLPDGKIDYSKFLIEIYTYSGDKLKNARINQNNDFFGDGLVSGTIYNILFTYDDIYLLCAEFMCDSTGKVIYLSPSHFMIVNEISKHSCKAGADLSNKVKRLRINDIPPTRWEKLLVANYNQTHHDVAKACIKNIKPIKFKAGSDLASKVK